jgi:hypothetical protein
MIEGKVRIGQCDRFLEPIRRTPHKKRLPRWLYRHQMADEKEIKKYHAPCAMKKLVFYQKTSPCLGFKQIKRSKSFRGKREQSDNLKWSRPQSSPNVLEPRS